MSGEAIVAKIDKIEEIPGANNIQLAFVLGEQVIVSKDKKVGDIGILFPAETQLSHEYVGRNGLYRHSSMNADQTKKGFFEDNRKVRAMKFMKVKSEAYFADLTSLDYIDASYSEGALKVGDRFSQLDGEEICRKFVSPQTMKSMINREPRKKYIETPLFKQHVDTDQFKYNVDRIPVGSLLSFHAKLHGTSARYSCTLVRKQPSTWLEKLKAYCGLFQSESWEYLAGTRRVVLYPQDREKEGYNGPEAWRFEWLDKLKPYLSKGMTVYGEIVGYANGAPIMAPHDVKVLNDKKYLDKYGEKMVYKYGCPEGTNRFIIYRITYTTPDGNELDFTVDQIKKWCADRGFEHTRELYNRWRLSDLDPDGDREHLKKVVEGLTETPGLTEDLYDPSHVAEGIVIRVDHGGTTPMFLKNKSFAFKVMEGIATLDTVDTEDAA